MTAWAEAERLDCFGASVGVYVEGTGPERALVAAELGRARRRLLHMHGALTRFDPNSGLSRLNRDPRARVPSSWLLVRLAGAAVEAGEMTGGLVDATSLDGLEAVGYVRDWEPQAAIPLTYVLRKDPPPSPAASGTPPPRPPPPFPTRANSGGGSWQTRCRASSPARRAFGSTREDSQRALRRIYSRQISSTSQASPSMRPGTYESARSQARPARSRWRTPSGAPRSRSSISARAASRRAESAGEPGAAPMGRHTTSSIPKPGGRLSPGSFRRRPWHRPRSRQRSERSSRCSPGPSPSGPRSRTAASSYTTTERWMSTPRSLGPPELLRDRPLSAPLLDHQSCFRCHRARGIQCCGARRPASERRCHPHP